MPTSRKKKPQRIRAPRARAGGAPSTARRGRPARVDRDFLLDAAEQAIRDSGAEVSLERIAATAGVTKPVLFAHIGDRRALVFALSERLLARMEAASQAATAQAPPGRAALVASFQASFEAIVAERHVYAFVNGAGAGDTTLATTLEFARRSAAPIIAGTAAARVAAGNDPAPAEAWGYAIVGMLHMVGIWWLNDPTARLDAAQLAEQLTELLWRGLAPRSKP